MEKKSRSWTKWLYWFTFAVAVIIIYKTVDSLSQIMDWLGGFLSILAPFASGILIAYILYIPCKKIEVMLKKTKKRSIFNKKARPISIFLVYLIAILIFIILFNFIIPPIIESSLDLANNFGNYFQKAVNQINSLPEDSFWKTEVITRIMNEIENIDIKQIINVELIGEYARGAINFANSIINIFVAFIVSIYILSSRGKILAFLKRAISASFHERAYKNIDKYFNRSNEIFFNFLTSQFIDAIVVGVLTSIAMSIMGVKYAVLLGVMIGLFNLIPYVGAIIAVVIAGIITLFTGGLPQAIWMLIVVTIIQQIDANIINPKIIGNSLKINPLLVILAITIGGAYFGMLGMFLSVPVVAIIKVIVEDFLEYKEQKTTSNNVIKNDRTIE